MSKFDRSSEVEEEGLRDAAPTIGIMILGRHCSCRRRADGGGVRRRHAMKLRAVCRPMEVRGTTASAAGLHGGMEAAAAVARQPWNGDHGRRDGMCAADFM